MNSWVGELQLRGPVLLLLLAACALLGECSACQETSGAHSVNGAGVGGHARASMCLSVVCGHHVLHCAPSQHDMQSPTSIKFAHHAHRRGRSSCSRLVPGSKVARLFPGGWGCCKGRQVGRAGEAVMSNHRCCVLYVPVSDVENHEHAGWEGRWACTCWHLFSSLTEPQHHHLTKRTPDPSQTHWHESTHPIRHHSTTAISTYRHALIRASNVRTGTGTLRGSSRTRKPTRK